MNLKLSPESQAKVAQALAMVEESRVRMNGYTEAQRNELEREGREMMRNAHKDMMVAYPSVEAARRA